ncbi:MAG: hypothetical protein ABJZ69_03445, partial [Hyphomicrobiales bacterium]
MTERQFCPALLPSEHLAAKARREPILTDAARCPNDINAQKADFAKSRIKARCGRSIAVLGFPGIGRV